MTYLRKNAKTVSASLALLLALAAFASWQFYKYVTFRDANGILNTEGGTSHLVWAVVMALFACGVGFLVASSFMRYDADDELHITSPPRKPPLSDPKGKR